MRRHCLGVLNKGFGALSDTLITVTTNINNPTFNWYYSNNKYIDGVAATLGTLIPSASFNNVRPRADTIGTLHYNLQLSGSISGFTKVCTSSFYIASYTNYDTIKMAVQPASYNYCKGNNFLVGASINPSYAINGSLPINLNFLWQVSPNNIK